MHPLGHGAIYGHRWVLLAKSYKGTTAAGEQGAVLIPSGGFSCRARDLRSALPGRGVVWMWERWSKPGGLPGAGEPMVVEPSSTLPGCWPPPQPLCDGTWGRIRQRTGFWRSPVARPEHPKVVAPQECSSNHSSSYYLATRDVTLGMKPLCWQWDTHGAAKWWGSGYKTPVTPCPPSAEVPGSCLEALANPPGCTCCVGSAGGIDAVDSCNQLECPGTLWDKRTLSITQWPGPAQRREGLPGTACLRLRQPGQQRYPGLPLTEILPKSSLGLENPCRSPQAGALTTCPNLPGAGHRPTRATIL